MRGRIQAKAKKIEKAGRAFPKLTRLIRTGIAHRMLVQRVSERDWPISDLFEMEVAAALQHPIAG
jgi:hypothetical protein